MKNKEIDFKNICWRDAHKWISRQIEKGKKWNFIKYGGTDSEDGLKKFLEYHKNEWDDIEDLSVKSWYELVEFDKQEYARLKDVEFNSCQGMIERDGENNDVKKANINDEHSCWQLYKKKLLSRNFDEDKVALIENLTWRIIKKISLNTTETGPVKGMVVGNVQSGKTANMAALMAMAADCGWNMFIVLSGTIDNLRIQTQNRLYEDLNAEKGNITWYPLGGQLGLKSEHKTSNLEFKNSNLRYLTVCLKNSKRLENLLKWLLADPNKVEGMKILVIDDEADQAGINTADYEKERSAINRYLCHLVSGRNSKGKIAEAKYKAINYIGYTATPYANFLNEIAPDKNGEESLFPDDFVAALAVSNEYFGPQQIFGLDGQSYVKRYDGLNIIRNITKDDIKLIRTVHEKKSLKIPKSLQDAILWFLCCSACVRFMNYKMPVSMLVHTSQNTDHQHRMFEAISRWMEKTAIEKIIEQCEVLWNEEKEEFSLELFREQYPDYGAFEKGRDVSDYPPFDKIKPYLVRLLNAPTQHIMFDSQEENLKYHNGIHFCIDNCKNNKITEEGEHVRLTYPNKSVLEKMEMAPVFIVIGGATLSRGLTIEGLVSSYFLRSVSQADTLMQMGRWFGYRKGYELLPRIWLSDDTKDKFKFLAEMDQELRDEIVRIDTNSIRPDRVGIKIMSSPIINLAGKNRMKNAEAVSWDYSGVFKETYKFPSKKAILDDNIKYAKSFLEDVNENFDTVLDRRSSNKPFVWRNVDFSLVKSFLLKFNFSDRIQPFDHVKELCDWIQQKHDEKAFKKWNVILAGLRGKNGKEWKLSFGSVKKIHRSRKLDGSEDEINIGYLSATTDILADIEEDNITPEMQMRLDEFNAPMALERRAAAGLEKVPQLLIYCVDKNSKYVKPFRSKNVKSEDSKKKVGRGSLKAKSDLIGLCMIIPGHKDVNGDFTRALRIKLPEIREEI